MRPYSYMYCAPHRDGVLQISIVGVFPIDIHRRVVHIISIVGVCPFDIHRRVVHKIDYRSLSTIYIRGLSTVKNKYLCLGKNACLRESVRTRGVWVLETPDIIVLYGCKSPVVSSKNLCCPRKTHGHVYHIDFELCDRSRD